MVQLGTFQGRAETITRYLGSPDATLRGNWRIYDDGRIRIRTLCSHDHGFMDDYLSISARIEDRGETVFDTSRITMVPGAWMHAIDFLYEKALADAADDAFEEYLRDRRPRSGLREGC